jgi:hypothetical protein
MRSPQLEPGSAEQPDGRALLAQRASLALRALFAALLLVTAVGKLLDNRGFAEIVAQYRLGIPGVLLLPASLGFSLGELALGAGLLAGWRLPALAALTAALQLGYLLLAGLTLARGIELANCGCFGVFLSRPLGWQTLLEDALLLALALTLCAALRSARAAGARGVPLEKRLEAFVQRP